MKPKIGIVGSGNIGWALKQMLKEDYEIRQGDITDGFDASNIDPVSYTHLTLPTIVDV